MSKFFCRICLSSKKSLVLQSISNDVATIMKKYIIVGLGNFGSSLAIRLTNAGNEVYGADTSYKRVDALKDQITSSVVLDCTDVNAIKAGLPVWDEADSIIVAIGEDIGQSILVTATFHQMDETKRLICRCINDTHQRVLEAIDDKIEIVHPEEESAERLTDRLSLTGAQEVFSLFDQHKVAEVDLPRRYFGVIIKDTDFRSKYHLNILSILRMEERTNWRGKIIRERKIMDPRADTLLQDGDRIVVFGLAKDLRAFVED